MSLDLPTLMVMQSFVLASAGAVLVVTWLQNRKAVVLALWGCANVIAAAGILLLLAGSVLRQPMLSTLAGCLLTSQSGLMWKVARTIDAKPAPLYAALLGAVAVSFAGVVPVLRDAIGSLSLTVGAGYFFAAAIVLWLGRRERLAARWPLIILTAIHGTALLIGIYSTLNGSTGQDAVPALTSVFGLIYFESIIFALGTSVYILALVKERNEVAGRRAAQIDPLTGVANRAGFLDKAQRVVERCRREGAPYSVMMFDLDRFKAINDTYGHAVGDMVIQHFCATTTAALRPNDVFGRIGGEEFAAVLPASGIEAAYVRAERIRDCFAAGCRFVGDCAVEATVSCGLSVSMDGTQTLGAALAEADAALYAAKTDGRNRVKRSGQSRAQRGASAVIRVA